MVAYRRLASVAASAAAATLNCGKLKKKKLIQKAISDRNMIMNLKPRGYSPRVMEELLA